MKKTGFKKRKAILKLLIIADFVMLFCMTASLAYFTSFDEITNRFTAFPMDILLFEEKFNAISSEKKSTLIPNTLLPKDPQIRNTEQTDVFVFVKVTVPVYSLSDVNDDGTIFNSQHRQEVFLLKTEEEKEAAANSFHTKKNDDDTEYWVELPSFEEGTDHSDTMRTYVFGYCVYLDAQETTETLFDYVELKNIRQFEVGSGDILNVQVDAYAVQADGIEGIMKTIGDHKAILTAEQLTMLYGMIEEPNGTGNTTG